MSSDPTHCDLIHMGSYYACLLHGNLDSHMIQNGFAPKQPCKVVYYLCAYIFNVTFIELRHCIVHGVAFSGYISHQAKVTMELKVEALVPTLYCRSLSLFMEVAMH